jgi:hypothetical protein
MRWEKDGQFIEIESGMSVDLNYAALWVSSSLPLPLDLRHQVRLDDGQRCIAFYDSVCQWAEREGLHAARNGASD